MDDNVNELSQSLNGNDDGSEGVMPNGSDESNGSAGQEDPYGVKKRLGQQAKKHEREMRLMREQIMQLQNNSAHGRQTFADVDVHHQNAIPSPGQPNGPSDSEEQRIQRAVRYALEAKDAEARKVHEDAMRGHVQKQYMRLDDEFNKASDKYDDFDDVVRGSDAPFTTAIRDALLLVDNPAEVAYKLGKNRDELSRVAKLHPLDQAREVNKLAFALMHGGSGAKGESQQGAGSLNAKRPNPANTANVTDRTPVSSIREKMKAGTWK